MSFVHPAYIQPEGTQQSSIQQDSAQQAQASEEPPPVVPATQLLGESSHEPHTSPSLPAPPLPPLPPSEVQDASQPPSAQPPVIPTSSTSIDYPLSTDEAATSIPSEAVQPSTAAIFHTTAPDAALVSRSTLEAIPVPPVIEEGAETPPITPPTSKIQTEELMMEEDAKERAGTEVLEDEGGEEIMECDMEIDDDESPEASGKETTPTPVPPTDAISIATLIPVSNSIASPALPDEGQKVNQDLLPSSQEISKDGAHAEDDEPLPPGVDEEKEPDEPLPPGMEDASGVLSTTKDAERTTVLSGDERSSNEPLLSQDAG